MMSQCSVQDIENKYEIDDRQKQKLIDQYNEMQDEIQKFSYEMQEIGIEQFYQMIHSIQLQNGKDGFADCIEDDRTRLSNMQNATRTTRNNVLVDINIEHTNDEQNFK